MPGPDSARLRELLKQATGPAPWYWQSFPAARSRTGQRFVWTHQGEQGSLAYVVTLALEHDGCRLQHWIEKRA